MKHFSEEELIYRSAGFNIYFVIGEGYYVGNKQTRELKLFNPSTYTYLEVFEWALRNIG